VEGDGRNWRRRREAVLGFGGLLRFAAGAAESV